MLLQFRNLTRGVVATVLLILIGGATVLFLIPSDGMNLNFSQNLAEVSGRAVTPRELTRELDVTLRMQRAEGQNVSRQDAIDAGVHLRMLEEVIARRAIQAYANDIGISASDSLVAERIRGIPQLANPVTGAFDQNAYAQFLNQLNYSQPEFEADIRGDLTTDLLLNAMVAGIRAPSSYGALAYAYDTETRVITLAEAPASVVGAVPQPTEAELQTLYEQSEEQLRLPEFRGLTLIYARPEDFLSRVEIPEQRLREEFEARRAALVRPERRTYVRIAAQTQAQANEAAARLGRGEQPNAVAQALGLQVSRGENQSRAEIPDARVADAVFSAAARRPQAVQASLSPWAVIRVDSITPAQEPNYAAVRDELRQAIAAYEAGNLLNEAIGAFEDARSGGAALADAAREHGLAVVTIPAVEQGGRDQSGQAIAALADQEEVLRTAFQTPEGEASDFIPVGEAVDVIVSVDRIIPASVRPLSEVSSQLAQIWVARERQRRLRELGAKVLTDVRGGQSFEAALRANGFRVQADSVQIDRQRASQIPAQGLAGQIFGAAEGDIVNAVRADGQSVIVAQVESIQRADAAAAPQQVEELRGQLEQGVVASFAESLRNAIVAEANVRRFENRIEQTFPPSSSESDAEGQ